MIHFTHTGQHAGRPICDAVRSEGIERGELFQHPAYNGPGYERQLADLCADCRKLWDEAAS